MNLTDQFLAGMFAYGPLAMGFALWLSELGPPIPAAVLVLAAGGLGRQGLIDWQTALVIGLLGVVLGDCTGYALGRLGGGRVQPRIERWRPSAWQTSQSRFRRHAALAVILTRTLFTSLDVPTNLIVGSSHYAFPRFLLCAVLGRTVWIAAFGAIGYAAGSQWRTISETVSVYRIWIGLLIVVVCGLYLLLSWLRRIARSGTSWG